MSHFDEYLERFNVDSFSKYAPFIGVVEDISDPLAVGRARVRAFNFHPEDRTLVPTEHLPWAIVAQPTTSGSISGVGWSPNGLQLGTWVIGYFADGPTAQYPIVTHTLPGIHRPNDPSQPGGGSGWITPEQYTEGNYDPDAARPYHNELMETGPAEVDDFGRPLNRNGPALGSSPNGAGQGAGAFIPGGATDIMLTLANQNNWEELGLPTYNWKPRPNGYGCADGTMEFHYATALAFEKLTKEYGRGKLTINSAYRSARYNSSVGGASGSMHMKGKALDISFDKIGNSQSEIVKFAQLAVKNGFVGFGVYGTFIHIDTGAARTWERAKQAWFIDGITAAGWSPGKKGLDGISSNPGTRTPAEQKAVDEATASNGAKPSANTNLSESERDAVIRTIYGEARGESAEGQAAVAQVIRNRSESWGKNPYDVVHQRAQFSAWEDSNLQHMQALSPSSSEYQRIGGIVDGVFSGSTPDATGGATHYYAPQGMAGGRAPTWWNDEVNKGGGSTQIGNHYFAGPGNGTASKFAPTAPSKGFVDPTNSLPFAGYRGTPSTHVNARGMNTPNSQTTVEARDAGRIGGFPAAGNQGTFGEPELAAAPQYPYNQTYGTTAGHLMEFDNTPGAERINIEHKSGSGIEIFTDGQVSQRTKGNKFETTTGDSYSGVVGKYYLTSVNDMSLRSTADMAQHADGSLSVIVGNDGRLLISGDYTVSIGDDIQIKAGGRVVIHGSGNVDVLSDAVLNLEGKGGVNIKGPTVNIEADGAVDIKGSEVHLDDVVRVGEGLAKGNEGADTADVGPPPARSEVVKDNLKSTANANKVITTAEAASHYGSMNI